MKSTAIEKRRLETLLKGTRAAIAEARASEAPDSAAFIEHQEWFIDHLQTELAKLKTEESENG